jgi:hypothetical protein
VAAGVVVLERVVILMLLAIEGLSLLLPLISTP